MNNLFLLLTVHAGYKLVVYTVLSSKNLHATVGTIRAFCCFTLILCCLFNILLQFMTIFCDCFFSVLQSCRGGGVQGRGTFGIVCQAPKKNKANNKM